MKSCMDCKHAEETMFDDCKKCVNKESVYYGIFVDNRELCRYWEAKEKAIPKHPKINTDSFGEDADGRRGIKCNTVVCPNCGTELPFLAEQCSVCNQKIKWECE